MGVGSAVLSEKKNGEINYLERENTFFAEEKNGEGLGGNYNG